MRLGLMVAALVAGVGLLVFIQTQSGQGFTALRPIDYVEYWAAGRLLVRGENPYELERLGPLEYEAGRSAEEAPIPMLNPPWTLPVVLPLGWLPAKVGHIAWLLFHLAVLFLCGEWLWRHFGGADAHRLLAHLIAWTFVPTSFALLAGQISPLLLLGAVAFLSFVRRGWDLAAGAACALLAAKPHLVYLFWPAVGLWAVGQGRWRVLAGGVLAGVVLTGVAMAYRPTVVADYWHMLRTKPPEQFESPTLGTLLRYAAADATFGPLLRRALGEGDFRWQFVSLVPGLVWFACWWPWRWRRGWDELLPMLLLVSMLTAPYGAWLFDLVLLLVPVLQVAAALSVSPDRRRWVAAAVHVAVNGAALWLWMSEVRYLAFIWMTPVLLAAYVLLRPPAGAPAGAPPGSKTRPGL